MSEEREREVVVNVSPEREMAPPYPLGDLHLVNVLIEMLTAFDELIFPHMILPFPSLSVIFSAEREVILRIPCDEREITDVDREIVDVVFGVTLTDISVSDPVLIV